MKFSANKFWTNWARAKLTAPLSPLVKCASEYVYHDLTRSSSSVDLRSRDLYVTSGSEGISFDASWWAECNETMHGAVALSYANLLAKMLTFNDVTWLHGCQIVKFVSRESGMVMNDVIHDRGCYYEYLWKKSSWFSPHRLIIKR